MTESTEYYNQKAEFDNALNELFEETYPKLYSAINAGKIRIYGMKFTEDTENKHISQISRQDLQFKLFDLKI